MLICLSLIFSTKSSRYSGKEVIKIKEVAGSIRFHLCEYRLI